MLENIGLDSSDSKVWVNLAFAVIAAIELITGALQPWLPIPVFETIAASLPAVNLFLCSLTGQCSTSSAKKKYLFPEINND